MLRARNLIIVVTSCMLNTNSLHAQDLSAYSLDGITTHVASASETTKRAGVFYEYLSNMFSFKSGRVPAGVPGVLEEGQVIGAPRVNNYVAPAAQPANAHTPSCWREKALMLFGDYQGALAGMATACAIEANIAQSNSKDRRYIDKVGSDIRAIGGGAALIGMRNEPFKAGLVNGGTGIAKGGLMAGGAFYRNEQNKTGISRAAEAAKHGAVDTLCGGGAVAFAGGVKCLKHANYKKAASVARFVGSCVGLYCAKLAAENSDDSMLKARSKHDENRRLYGPKWRSGIGRP